MKLQSILATSLLAITAALSSGVQAASDINTPAVAQTPAAEAQGVKAMKPHSHVEEKGGVVSKNTSTQPVDEKPAPKQKRADQDRTKHFHPRDGK